MRGGRAARSWLWPEVIRAPPIGDGASFAPGPGPLVVTKLDRLVRSLPNARAIADELTARQISLSLGGSVYDPTDAVGRLLFDVLAMVANRQSSPT